MLDIFNIPGQQDNIKIYYASDTNTWQTWTKPRNCKFIWMMCIGGGAAGGDGSTVSSGTGGGGGGISRVLFPASVLPDILFVQPGAGGKTSAASGSRSFVTIAISGSTPAAMNTVCVSGNVSAQIATGETVATVANMGLASLGNFSATAGLSNNGTYLTSTIVSGGGNGGSNGSPGAGFASINIGANIVTPTIAAGDNTTGGKGADGVWSWKPMYGLGGAGGGYNASGIGGSGGNGAFGCGGGAGAQGTTAGGTGGKGGDGLVIIVSF